MATHAVLLLKGLPRAAASRDGGEFSGVDGKQFEDYSRGCHIVVKIGSEEVRKGPTDAGVRELRFYHTGQRGGVLYAGFCVADAFLRDDRCNTWHTCLLYAGSYAWR